MDATGSEIVSSKLVGLGDPVSAPGTGVAEASVDAISSEIVLSKLVGRATP